MINFKNKRQELNDVTGCSLAYMEAKCLFDAARTEVIKMFDDKIYVEQIDDLADVRIDSMCDSCSMAAAFNSESLNRLCIPFLKSEKIRLEQKCVDGSITPEEARYLKKINLLDSDCPVLYDCFRDNAFNLFLVIDDCPNCDGVKPKVSKTCFKCMICHH